LSPSRLFVKKHRSGKRHVLRTPVRVLRIVNARSAVAATPRIHRHRLQTQRRRPSRPVAEARPTQTTRQSAPPPQRRAPHSAGGRKPSDRSSPSRTYHSDADCLSDYQVPALGRSGQSSRSPRASRPLRMSADAAVVSERHATDWAEINGTMLHAAFTEGRALHATTSSARPRPPAARTSHRHTTATTHCKSSKPRPHGRKTNSSATCAPRRQATPDDGSIRTTADLRRGSAELRREHRPTRDVRRGAFAEPGIGEPENRVGGMGRVAERTAFVGRFFEARKDGKPPALTPAGA
jgi:hypothetical protein